MAKIAVELEQALAQRASHGVAGSTAARTLAQGAGWSVEDVLCTCGPRDRPFEERHSRISIALVTAGSFQYRSASSRELMTPGSVMLGNASQCFECGHEHGMGDRCLSFGYAPDYFETLAASIGVKPAFPVLRLPPLRELAPLTARASANLAEASNDRWEEVSMQLAVEALSLSKGLPLRSNNLPSTIARVTGTVRAIDHDPSAPHTLSALAQEAGLSPFYFLRAFEAVTSLTPHQYILRTRLREAARRLAEPVRILDIALDCGFGDISNFNRSFRAEFGLSPRAFRARKS